MPTQLLCLVHKYAIGDTALALQLCCINSDIVDTALALQLCCFKSKLCNSASMNTALALQLCCLKSNVLDTILTLQLFYSNSLRANIQPTFANIETCFLDSVT